MAIIAPIGNRLRKCADFAAACLLMHSYFVSQSAYYLRAHQLQTVDFTPEFDPDF